MYTLTVRLSHELVSMLTVHMIGCISSSVMYIHQLKEYVAKHSYSRSIAIL